MGAYTRHVFPISSLAPQIHESGLYILLGIWGKYILSSCGGERNYLCMIQGRNMEEKDEHHPLILSPKAWQSIYIYIYIFIRVHIYIYPAKFKNMARVHRPPPPWVINKKGQWQSWASLSTLVYETEKVYGGRRIFWTWKIMFLRAVELIVLSFLVLRYTSNSAPDGSFNILKNTFIYCSTFPGFQFSWYKNTLVPFLHLSCLSTLLLLSNCFGRQFGNVVGDIYGLSCRTGIYNITPEILKSDLIEENYKSLG